MKSFFRWFVLLLFGLGLIGLIGYLLVAYGVIRMNYPSKLIYPVQGIDVSHHQGEIDFTKVVVDGWEFVIMKSTEGGDWKDTKFSSYYKAAKEAGLVVGVYHYYSFCKDPIAQAKHYTSVSGDLHGDLPPAVDLEFDNNCNGTIAVEKFRTDFQLYVNEVVNAYGVYPIVYCNESFYTKYLKTEEFSSCLFWIRNVVSQPDLGGVEWTFWQYTADGRVEGIKGDVDLNAYSGRKFEFQELIMD